MRDLDIRIDTLRMIFQQMYGLCISVYEEGFLRLLETNTPYPSVIDLLIQQDEQILHSGDRGPFTEGNQYFYSNAMGMVWLFCVCGDHVYLLGPAFTDDYSTSEIINRLGKLQAFQNLKQELSDFVNRIPIISAFRMCHLGTMLQITLMGESDGIEDLKILSTTQSAMENKEIPADHFTNYVLEQKIWQAVRDGNIHYRKDLEYVLSGLAMGDFSDGKYLRQEKNLAIIQTALACRAAVEGGLPPEVAYPLSDQYIRRIESGNSVSELSEISSVVLDDYIQRVYNVKQQSGLSAQVLACCEHIRMYPEEKLNIQEMAQRYGYTPYYFSKKFRQEVGMTVSDYAAAQKIERAKELLRRPDITISDISEYLGFNSQSYFGMVFKKYTAMTPGAYRSGILETTERMKTHE